MTELLNRYSIDDISKKTMISHLILEKLLNKDFKKINKVKFYGFIKILKTEYPDVNFDDLIKDFETYTNPPKKETTLKENNSEKDTKKNNKPYFIVVLLFLIIIYLISNMQPTKEPHTIQKEMNETNSSLQVEENKTQIAPKKIIKKEYKKLIVYPIKQVWFKVYFLDKNSSQEYLTSHKVDIDLSKKVFIKFGHGEIILNYADKNISVNRKNITRILIQNNELNITKKRLKEFK